MMKHNEEKYEYFFLFAEFFASIFQDDKCFLVGYDLVQHQYIERYLRSRYLRAHTFFIVHNSS